MKNIISIVLAVLALLLALVAVGTVPTAQEIASNVKVPTAVNTQTTIVQEVNNSKLDELYEDYFSARDDETKQNDTAKAHVSEEIAKKSFRTAVMDLLNDEGQSVEKYTHLTITESKITKVTLNDDEATVKVTLYVDFYNDGDAKDDEEARVYAVFNVTDLVVDDDFEDVDSEYSLVLSKIY
jgi:hypothetical protein